MAKRGLKNWIAGAIKRPGALRKKAKSASALTSKGTIEKSWLAEQASKGSSTTARQARLAQTLGRLRRGKKKSARS